MMIRLLIFLASLFLFGACASSESVSGTRAERVVSEIHDPASKKVLVASHRGDWRNYPENSIAAIEVDANRIDAGAGRGTPAPAMRRWKC